MTIPHHKYHINAWPFHHPEDESKEQAVPGADKIEQALGDRHQKEPFSWEELQRIIKEKDYDSLCRSESEQAEYTRFRQELRTEWKSLDDYLLVSIFHFEEQTDPDTKLKVAHPSLEEYKKQTKKEKHLELTPNKFAYFVGEDVVHMVLWKLGGGPCTDKEISDAKEQIQTQQGEKGLEVAEFLCWTNPPQNKSVPDIEHCQMLCLTKKKGEAVKQGCNCIIS